MLPHLGFLYMDSGEWTQVLILAYQCLLTEVSWGSHSTAFASVENQVKIIAEILSPPAASSNLRTHPKLCAHATNYQNHPKALLLKTQGLKTELTTELRSSILSDSAGFLLSSRQFSANIRILTLTCWQGTSQSLSSRLMWLLPFASGLEHIYLEQIKLS